MTDPQAGTEASLCALAPDPSNCASSVQTDPIFPIQLNDRWRVSWDDLQWVLEHCVSVKSGRWQDRRFHQQRDWLLKSIKELCGPVDPEAQAAIQRFPGWHH